MDPDLTTTPRPEQPTPTDHAEVETLILTLMSDLVAQVDGLLRQRAFSKMDRVLARNLLRRAFAWEQEPILDPEPDPAGEPHEPDPTDELVTEAPPSEEAAAPDSSSEPDAGESHEPDAGEPHQPDPTDELATEAPPSQEAAAPDSSGEPDASEPHQPDPTDELTTEDRRAFAWEQEPILDPAGELHEPDAGEPHQPDPTDELATEAPPSEEAAAPDSSGEPDATAPEPRDEPDFVAPDSAGEPDSAGDSASAEPDTVAEEATTPAPTRDLGEGLKIARDLDRLACSAPGAQDRWAHRLASRLESMWPVKVNCCNPDNWNVAFAVEMCDRMAMERIKRIKGVLDTMQIDLGLNEAGGGDDSRDAQIRSAMGAGQQQSQRTRLPLVEG